MAKNKEKYSGRKFVPVLCQIIKKKKEREIESHDLEQVAYSHLGFSLFLYKMSELDKKDSFQL